jgi:hypothetical protein
VTCTLRAAIMLLKTSALSRHELFLRIPIREARSESVLALESSKNLIKKTL